MGANEEASAFTIGCRDLQWIAGEYPEQQTVQRALVEGSLKTSGCWEFLTPASDRLAPSLRLDVDSLSNAAAIVHTNQAAYAKQQSRQLGPIQTHGIPQSPLGAFGC